MKTFKPLIFAAAIAIAGVSCTKGSSVSEPSGNKVPMTFSVSSSDAFTKTAVDGVKVLWEGTDKIAVFDGLSMTPNKFDLTEEAGTTSAKFRGSVSEGATEFHAIYPYGTDASYSEKTFSSTIPTDQSATAQDISANIMVADADGDGVLNFRNATALIQFTVTETGIRKITFRGNNSEGIAGDAVISFDGTSAPEIVAGEKTVQIEAAEGETLAEGTYYLAVAPVSFTKGFRFTFYDTELNGTEVVGANPASLAAGDKLNLGTISLTPWKTTVTVDKSAMAEYEDRLAIWSLKLQKGNILRFVNFDDAKVSEMLNLAVFTDIDDTNCTARYVGAEQDYEVYYLPTQKWLLLTSNYLQADRYILIGKNCSFAQSPYTDYPLIESDIQPTKGQALSLNKVSEGVFRAYIYLADDFAIHLYSGTAWANMVKGWTSGSPDFLVAKDESPLYYGVQDVSKTFTPGIYLVEYDKNENKITFSK